MTIRLLLQLVFFFLTVAAQAATGGNFADANGNEQIVETTDSHPFWVVSGNPELWRAAQEVVNKNGTILYHENLGITENGYWVEAKDLKVGDVFIGANGELSTLVNKERVEFPEGITVYNFTVDRNHDYFVIAQTAELGQTCILVHNGCGTRPPYKMNPQHDKHSFNYKPGKTPEPHDAGDVFKNKAIEDPNKPGTWYAVQDGKIYTFQSKNNATAHFTGYFGIDANGNPNKAIIKGMLNKIRGWQGE